MKIVPPIESISQNTIDGYLDFSSMIKMVKIPDDMVFGHLEFPDLPTELHDVDFYLSVKTDFLHTFSLFPFITPLQTDAFPRVPLRRIIINYPLCKFSFDDLKIKDVEMFAIKFIKPITTKVCLFFENRSDSPKF